MNILSGVLGSWLALGVVYPFEHARNQISNNVSRQNSSILKIMMRTTNTQGFSALYTGCTISMIGVALFRGTYFGVFDTFKGDREGLARWSIAYISSLLAILVTYPSDTIRKRLICSKTFNKKYTGFTDCSLKVYKKEGLGSFVRGYPVIFFQSLVRSGVLFLYDKVARDFDYIS